MRKKLSSIIPNLKNWAVIGGNEFMALIKGY